MNSVHQLDDIFSILFPHVIDICMVAWATALGVIIAEHIRKAEKGENFLDNAALKGEKFLGNVAFFAALFVFGGIIASTLYVCNVIVSNAQREVMPQLQGQIYSVQIDGRNLRNFAPLIADIRKINTSYSRYHHSHPTHCIEISLRTENGDLLLNLARASGNPQEYWVFYPLYKTTSKNDIGKVSTSVLDGL